MKIKKRSLFITIIVLIIVIISATQVKRLKFLFEIIKLSNSLPTISSDFYNDPNTYIITGVGSLASLFV